MTIVDDSLLDEFRGTIACGWCRRVSQGRLDPHHLFGRGHGGGSRLDHRWNLIALCRACHNDVHAGHIRRADLLAMVAVREGVLQDQIEAEIYRLLRTAKEDA